MYTIYTAKTDTHWKIMNLTKLIKELEECKPESFVKQIQFRKQKERLQDKLSDAYTVDNFEWYYRNNKEYLKESEKWSYF